MFARDRPPPGPRPRPRPVRLRCACEAGEDLIIANRIPSAEVRADRLPDIRQGLDALGAIADDIVRDRRAICQIAKGDAVTAIAADDVSRAVAPRHCTANHVIGSAAGNQNPAAAIAYSYGAREIHTDIVVRKRIIRTAIDDDAIAGIAGNNVCHDTVTDRRVEADTVPRRGRRDVDAGRAIAHFTGIAIIAEFLFNGIIVLGPMPIWPLGHERADRESATCTSAPFWSFSVGK